MQNTLREKKIYYNAQLVGNGKVLYEVKCLEEFLLKLYKHKVDVYKIVHDKRFILALIPLNGIILNRFKSSLLSIILPSSSKDGKFSQARSNFVFIFYCHFY